MNYKATVKVLGKSYTAEGDTVWQAIANLEPLKAKGMSILTVSKGSKTQERVLPTASTVRLFSPSKLTRELALKNMSLRFDI